MESSTRSVHLDEAGNEGMPIPELNTRDLEARNLRGRIGEMKHASNGRRSHTPDDYNHGGGYQQVQYNGTGNVPGINPQDYYNSGAVPPFVPQYRQNNVFNMNNAKSTANIGGSEGNNGCVDTPEITMPGTNMFPFPHVSLIYYVLFK